MIIFDSSEMEPFHIVGEEDRVIGRPFFCTVA